MRVFSSGEESWILFAMIVFDYTQDDIVQMKSNVAPFNLFD